MHYFIFLLLGHDIINNVDFEHVINLLTTL